MKYFKEWLMSAIPIGNGYNGWGAVLLCSAIGIAGAALTLCNKKTKKVALDVLFRATFSLMGKKSFSSEKERSTLTRKMIQAANIRKEHPLVSGKKPCKLPGGARFLVRETMPNGDCFFLCAAIGLLEFLQKNKTHLSFIIDLIESDSSLLVEDKEKYIKYLTHAAFLEDEAGLDVFFEDNDLMNQLVMLLRCLMGSALEEEPEVATLEGPLAKVLAKEDFYAEIVGSLDCDSDARAEYPQSNEFTSEGFKKIVRLIRYSFSWPSDACIRALCLKLNIGFSVLKEAKGRFLRQTCVENLPSAGTLLLMGNHYSKIYLIPQFSISRKDFSNEEGAEIKSIEIKAAQEDLFFLGVSVAVLDFLYKNKESQAQFNAIAELSSECVEIMSRARCAETESDLQRVFKDDPAMRKMTNTLRFLVKDLLKTDLKDQAEFLFNQLDLFINVGIERSSESGDLSVEPVFSSLDNKGLLLLQGAALASFFPEQK